MNVGAIILAAGFSRRLGRPKQEVVLDGETLLARAVGTAQEAGLGPIIVVVRDAKWVHSLTSKGVSVVINARAEQGMATSVVLGVQQVQQNALSGVVLMTCDQPLLTAQHLHALCADQTRITASRYADRNGVPAYFPATAFAALLGLSGDTGARSLLQGAHAVTDETLALDIDTEQDLERAKQQLEVRL